MSRAREHFLAQAAELGVFDDREGAQLIDVDRRSDGSVYGVYVGVGLGAGDQQDAQAEPGSLSREAQALLSNPLALAEVKASLRGEGLIPSRGGQDA